MKKIVISLIICLMMFLNMITVHAAGNISVSSSNLSITEGSSKTFTIKASNAAGRIDISTSNKNVISINKSSEFLDNSSVTVTVKALKKGTATITIKLTDVATYDREELTGARTVKITVTEKKVAPTPPKAEEPKKEEPKKEEHKEEKNNNEEEDKYEKALKLVKKAEKTRKLDDVNKAKEAVNELEFSEKKYELLNRLYNIIIDMKQETKKAGNDMKDLSTDVTRGMSWFFLSIILLICLFAETIYLIAKEVKKNEV